jgi:hypothetical protein
MVKNNTNMNSYYTDSITVDIFKNVPNDDPNMD